MDTIRTGLHLGGLALIALLLGACGGGDTAGKPDAAQTAPAEVLFTHPLGFSAVIPTGWSIQALDDGQHQLVPPDAREGEAVIITAMRDAGMASVRDPATIRDSEREMSALYPQLSRVGPPDPLDTRGGEAVGLHWEGAPPGGYPVRLSVYLAALGDTAVSVMAAGLRDDVLARTGDIESLVRSLQPAAAAAAATTPVVAATSPGTPTVDGQLHDGSAPAREWAARLAGRQLTVMSGYNSGGGGGGMNSRYDLKLFADGRFDYYGGSSVSIYVEGLDGSSASEESEQGTWRVINVAEGPTLELVASSGQLLHERLTRSGNDIYLTGTRVLVSSLAP